MKILLILFLLLTTNIIAQISYFEFDVQITSRSNNIVVNYYSSNFIIEDSVEYVDFILDNNLKSTKKGDNIWKIQIPYESNYLIEFHNLINDQYKYIQVGTGNKTGPKTIIIPSLNFDYKTRLCIYYDIITNSYKQFITTEPYD